MGEATGTTLAYAKSAIAAGQMMIIGCLWRLPIRAEDLEPLREHMLAVIAAGAFRWASGRPRQKSWRAGTARGAGVWGFGRGMAVLVWG